MTYLRTIGITSRVGHAEDARTNVFQLEIFVIKSPVVLSAINGSTTRSIMLMIESD